MRPTEEPEAPTLGHSGRVGGWGNEETKAPFPGLSTDALAEPYEGLEAEECGILDGCAHGRCVRVPEGFTCDCFDGYRLDITRMACVGEGRWGEAGLAQRGWGLWCPPMDIVTANSPNIAQVPGAPQCGAMIKVSIWNRSERERPRTF